MKTLIGVGVAVVFFLLVYKVIIPPRRKRDETNHFVCDVCKGKVCECRPDDGKSDS